MGFLGDLFFDALNFYLTESRHQEVVDALENNKKANAPARETSQYVALEKRIATVEAENKALRRQLHEGE